MTDSLLPDEEIIVIDGNSSDGTPAYLEQLYQHKKIQYYITEPDQNQAQAWNKGFLLANGKIIKKVMDDDVFCLTAIQNCKNWMLEHPTADICISNSLQTSLDDPAQINKTDRLKQFQKWQAGKSKCFSFCDVYMLIRKAALSFTGLYDTQFRMIDWEFALRCSFLGAKIAYYTGFNTLTVHTPGNVSSLTTQQALKKEAKIAKVKYGYPGDRTEISLWSEIKIFIGINLNRFKKNAFFININTNYNLPDEQELNNIYNQLYEILETENRGNTFSFLC